VAAQSLEGFSSSSAITIVPTLKKIRHAKKKKETTGVVKAQVPRSSDRRETRPASSSSSPKRERKLDTYQKTKLTSKSSATYLTRERELQIFNCRRVRIFCNIRIAHAKPLLKMLAPHIHSNVQKLLLLQQTQRKTKTKTKRRKPKKKCKPKRSNRWLLGLLRLENTEREDDGYTREDGGSLRSNQFGGGGQEEARCEASSS